MAVSTDAPTSISTAWKVSVYMTAVKPPENSEKGTIKLLSNSTCRSDVKKIKVHHKEL